jgi:hypothetical protein
MPMRVIMAVENAFLRDALLSAIAPLHCTPEVLMPDALLQTELSGDVLIFLETSDDVERLIDTAKCLHSRWTESDKTGLQFLSYSTMAVTSDDVVFRLWSIGREMTVIVQAWESDNMLPYLQGAYALTRRLLEYWNN